MWQWFVCNICNNVNSQSVTGLPYALVMLVFCSTNFWLKEVLPQFY